MNEKQSKWTVITWVTSTLAILETLYFIGMTTSYPDADGGLLSVIVTLLLWPGSLVLAAYVSWRKPWKHSQIIASGLLVANIAVPLVLARIFLD